MTGITTFVAAQDVERYAHGTRNRYAAGRCRCDACRKANSLYENERQRARKAGDWNGYVPADAARAHLLKLSRQGVGRRAVRAATDLSETVLQRVRTGMATTIRARTERLILAVTKACISDGALVAAGKTQTLIAELLDEGYTKERICAERGVAKPYIQIGRRRVKASTAAQVERIHRRLTT